MHTVGPILASFHNNPNVTGILWADLPGSESGPAITSVLYGQHNPSGKLPFTVASQRADFGPSVLYQPNNGVAAPQQNLSGLDLDYRHFDIHNITPVYEFGFGLSYTTFKYSDLTITDLHASAYTPNDVALPSAPTLNPLNLTQRNLNQYLKPADVLGQSRYPTFIYPYLTSTNLSESSGDSNYGLEPSQWLPENARSSAPPKSHPARGAPGGNPLLWTPVLNVSLAVTNSGKIGGHEVVQVYLDLAQGEPPRVLRGFERVWLEVGETKKVTMQLLRRDVSIWDVMKQDWVMGGEDGRIGTEVGASSRDIRLKGRVVL